MILGTWKIIVKNRKLQKTKVINRKMKTTGKVGQSPVIRRMIKDENHE